MEERARVAASAPVAERTMKLRKLNGSQILQDCSLRKNRNVIWLGITLHWFITGYQIKYQLIYGALSSWKYSRLLEFFLWKRTIDWKTVSLPEDSELYAYDQSWWPCMKHHSNMTQMINPKPWQEKKRKMQSGL